MVEINSYNITNKDEQEKLMEKKINLVELENSKTEYNCLRAWLIPDLLRVLKENRHYDYPQNIFEIGTVFTKDVKELQSLSILKSEGNFTEIKQILDVLFRSINLNYENNKPIKI